MKKLAFITLMVTSMAQARRDFHWRPWHDQTGNDFGRIVDRLQYHPLFGRLGTTALNRTWWTGFSRGDYLHMAGRDEDHRYYAILEGQVWASTPGSPGRRNMIRRIFLAPAGFGELNCLSGIPAVANYRAVTDGCAVRIDAMSFNELMTTDPTFAQSVWVDLAHRVNALAHNQAILLHQTTQERLMNLYTDLAGSIGASWGHGLRRIDTPISHDDAGAMIGVTRETVSRVMPGFSHEGLIMTDKKQKSAKIVDYGRLRAMAPNQRLNLVHTMGVER